VTDVVPLFKAAAPACGSCHNDTTKSGGLAVISQANFTTDLINKPACANFSNTQPYVIPGNPDGSFLVAKIDPTVTLGTGCGAHMPVAAPGGPPPEPLTPQAVAIVRQWITDGALP
jgi:hypothetical protein